MLWRYFLARNLICYVAGVRLETASVFHFLCFRSHVKQGDGLLVLQTEGPRVSILTHRTFSDENRF